MNYLERAQAFEHSTVVLNQPFLKWAGGKRWLFRRYRHLFPARIERLLDPFVGGGSSLFYLQPTSALLSDLNGDLVDLYTAVRTDPRRVTRLLIRYHHSHCKKFYYAARAKKPNELFKKAAWLLYLNRTCWNGLFRVNLRGEFNVPIGTKTKVFSSIDELDWASTLLNKATVRHSDFERVIDCAVEGDVVFADPPYFEKDESQRFLKYNSAVFSWPDQLRLRNALLRARDRGATCFITNANHGSLVKLYKRYGSILEISRHSVLSGANHGRGLDHEILVELK
jgi:DNA adenine methylase